MKTLALKEKATPSTSSQTSFNKKGEGSFLSSTNKVEHPFSTPNPGIQRNPIGSSISGGHNFANIPIFPPFSQPVIQPKLTINEPGDKYEQEADAMAEQVMRMTSVSPGGDRPQTGLSTVPSLQRKCAACEEEEKIQRAEMEEEEPLQTKPLLMRKAEGGGYTASPQLQSQLNSSKGGGNPLPGPTLSSMSQAFGADFSSVRVHTGTQAAEMSQGIQAKAFTHGGDIYFNQGQYNPETGEGKRLLGHELTHVVQQGGRQTKPNPVSESSPAKLIQRKPIEPGETPWTELTRATVKSQISHQLGVFYSNFGDAAVEVKVKSAIDELKESKSLTEELLFGVAAGFLSVGLSKLVLIGIKKGFVFLAKKSITIGDQYLKLSSKDNAEKLLVVYSTIATPAIDQAKSFVKGQIFSVGSDKATEDFIDNLRVATNHYTLNIAGQLPTLNDDKLKSLLFALAPENIEIGRFKTEISQLAQEFKKNVYAIGSYSHWGFSIGPTDLTKEQAIWIEGVNNRKVLAYVEYSQRRSHYHFWRWIPPSVSEMALTNTKNWFGSVQTISVDDPNLKKISLYDWYQLKLADEKSYEAWVKGSE